jgi:hypothetical protein
MLDRGIRWGIKFKFPTERLCRGGGLFFNSHFSFLCTSLDHHDRTTIPSTRATTSGKRIIRLV